MPFNQYISRSDAAALIPEDVSAEIISNLPTMNPLMQLARRLPNMSTNQRRLPVLGTFASAYFVNGDTGLKQTSKIAWENKYIDAEELAVMVPIAEDLLMDTENTGYDLFGELTPRIGEAIGKLVDQAVFHGTNLPSTWLTNTSGASASLLSGATSASHTVQSGTGTDIYDDIFGEAGVLSLVEADGFDATGMVGGLSTKGILRQVRAERTATGAGLPMFESNGASGEMTLGGYRCIFPKNNAIDATTAVLFSGDFSQLVYAIRQDITVKVITEGVISDDEGAILINLAQQDMVALRFVFRLGFQISNYVTQAQGTEGSRYPFAVLTPAGT
jgi:HK97 family phage major capsid protein